MSPALFLVWHGAPGARLEIGDPSHPLSDQMLMVRTQRTLSRLYHAIKHQLPEDTALCVAPLADDPKFKGMAEGALKWLRGGA
ncbi:hypothetical protein [Sagittula salina]|uniref:Uncharacterized protein n=1 Tax=Sagittula salina TaxID=2820268 RepID=A0A940MNV8_9RHOB|nr:hypothetical protein [Sagittula salina]MBP0482056.1 hypothetical protein [Sagittula salina]